MIPDPEQDPPSLATALAGAEVDTTTPTGALALRLALDLDASIGRQCDECERGEDADPRLVARFLDVLAALGILTADDTKPAATSPLTHLRAVSDDRRNA